MSKKNSGYTSNRLLYSAALIGIGFLWTGTAYIVQAYRLLIMLSGGVVNLITCGAYYVCQAAGVGVVAILFAKRPATASGRMLPVCVTVFGVVCTAAALYSSSLTVIIVCGVLLNLAIGILSGCYLTRLATDVPQQQRGIVFGSVYAFGSIGTWLISLPMQSRFLWHSESFFAIALLAALSLLLLSRLAPPFAQEEKSDNLREGFGKKMIALAAAVLFLLSMENTLGFAFPLKGAADSVYIEFTRAFYGVGLIIAGLVSDKNRRWGAICCLAALAFPFGALALGSNVAGETAMWMLAYLFLGFWSAYRILVFSDISAKNAMPALAVFGLLFGRLGEAAGTLGAELFNGTPLIVLSGIIFVLVIALFFLLYQKLYASVVNPEELERQRFEEYVVRFGFSAREQEIFALIIRGMSNAEIAGALYITESTVKFHVGNIFKKSGHPSRAILIANYKLGAKHKLTD